MSPNVISLFSPEQEKKLKNTLTEIYNSRFIDPANPPSRQEIMKSYRDGMSKLYNPERSDLSNPENVYREEWNAYLSALLLHGQPENKKGTQHFDTTSRRNKTIKRLAKYLGHIPTSSDLRAAFPTLTEIDDEMSRAIDKDIEDNF